MMILLVVVVGASALWVARDSRGRDLSGSRLANARWQWIAGTLGLWIVVFPAYLIVRRDTPTPGATSGALAAPVAPVSRDADVSRSAAPPGFGS